METSKKKSLIEQASQSEIKTETAVKIVKDLLKAASSSNDFSSSIKIKVNDSENKSAPNFCAVCVSTPFGSYCVLPPGGSC